MFRNNNSASAPAVHAEHRPLLAILGERTGGLRGGPPGQRLHSRLPLLPPLPSSHSVHQERSRPHQFNGVFCRISIILAGSAYNFPDPDSGADPTRSGSIILVFMLFIIAIYGPYDLHGPVLYVMLLMHANSLRGRMGPGNRDFFGTCKMASSR
jgi:hypothetical protein